MNRRAPLLVLASLLLLPGAALVAQTVPLDPVVVTALRAETTADAQPFSTRVLSGAALRESPSVTLDSALRSIPSFSLFRRSDSLTAHPTTQGVSLRGLGPSGASRSLVLLDGVPVNDPFGGWVTWTKLPRESLSRVEVVSGGGATAWGNAALGGVVQLLTEQPRETGGRVTALVGDFATRSAEWELSGVDGNSSIQLSGRAFSSGGYRTVAPEARGPVDLAANNQHHWFTGKWRQAVSDKTTVTVTAQIFREERNNGTPYQKNSTDDRSGSVAVDSHPSADFQWHAVAYGEDEAFASTFGAVNATRTAETPASDQYDVPATAVGAAWTGEWSGANAARTVVGADARMVRGESRENVTFANGQFTRRRAAGGKQATTGIFLLHEREVLPNLRATVGSRLDYWQDASGLRREQDIVSGTFLRNDRFAGRDGWEWSPSAGLAWKVQDGLRLRLSGQHAFRRPTLNELYRPFRVGNVITEANPALGTETVNTLETGAEFVAGRWSAAVTGYWNELHGAVSNVTIARGPGTFPLFGFIPAGGLGRQRQNLDRVRVRGVELSTRWQWRDDFAFTADFLANDAVVRKAAAAPNLVGLRVAQVPRFSGSVGLNWSGLGGWSVSPRVRWMGAQFEDDENLLRLAPALVVDCSISRSIGRRLDVFLSVENLFNERIETGRSATRVINVGTPRFATGGVRVKF